MHAATQPSTVTALPAAARPRRSLGRRITLLMLLPSTLWFLLLLLMPLVIILVFSFGERSAVGGYAGGFTLANYLNLGSRAAAFGNTLMLAPLGTLVCLVAAPNSSGLSASAAGYMIGSSSMAVGSNASTRLSPLG